MINLSKVLISFKHIIFFIFLLIPGIAISQSNNKVDSLLQLFKSDQADTSRIFINTQLAKEYQSINIDSAIFFANEALILAKEINFYFGLAESYATLGDIEVIRDNLDLARDLYLKSINFFTIVDRKQDLTLVYLVLGNIYLTQDNYFNALQNYHKGVNIAEEIDLKEAMEYLYSNLGLLYNKIENTEKALEFLQKAMDVTKESNRKESLSAIYINIGSIYFSLGDLQLAKTYFEKAKTIAIETKDKAIESNTLNALGEIYEKEKLYEKALTFYFESLSTAQLIDDKYLGPKSTLFARSYSHIGSLYYTQKRFKEAIDYLEKGYNLAQETGQLNIASNNAEELSLAYEALNQIETSLKYSRIFKTISDSVLNEDIIKKIAQVELQSEFDQQLKEKELEQIKKDALQKRKELIYIMVAAGSVLGLLVFVLLYLLLKNKVTRIELNEKNLKLEKETLEKELEYKNKELTTNVMYLLKKNEFILTITEKLKIAKMDFKVENKKIAEDIIRELENSISTDTWKEFELRFQEVHIDFYDRLNNLYPDLSPNEQKLCAFLRLNMTSKEIATITYQSINSINIARHRLRKKLVIEQEENLISFLTQL